jgi:hypothetical protein
VNAVLPPWVETDPGHGRPITGQPSRWWLAAS